MAQCYICRIQSAIGDVRIKNVCLLSIWIRINTAGCIIIGDEVLGGKVCTSPSIPSILKGPLRLPRRQEEDVAVLANDRG